MISIATRTAGHVRFHDALLAVVLLLVTQALPALEQPDQVLDEALVIGEQPGPGLWKVTKGDNVLWVLPNYGPLSKEMTWHPQQMQARIAESQEVIYPPNVNVYPSIGLFHALTLLPSLLKVGKNPDGATLQQVLPPDLYARWVVVREKYVLAKNVEDLEAWRPGVAVMQLQGAALARNGLIYGRVDSFVSATAKKNKIRLHRLPSLNRAVKVEHPRDMLNSARKVQQPELGCFIRVLDAIEPDVERAKARANAWSRGDIPKLRELYREYPRSNDCIFALLTGFTELENADASRAKKILADAEWHDQQGRVQSQRDWVAAAQLALQKNRSTFAVLPVGDVLLPGGHLEKLRELGYTVEEPL